ncbi:MAG: hypothetical protein R3F11_15135 [Verrucomicrobiales bacterium]
MFANPRFDLCRRAFCAVAAPLTCPAADLVAAWDFDGQKCLPGFERVREARTPTYPDESAANMAAFFKAGQAIKVPHAEEFAFRQGGHDHAGGVGRCAGRRRRKPLCGGQGADASRGLPQDNQNYALRVRETGGAAAPSFLFSSQPEPGKPSEYHRWTAKVACPGRGRDGITWRSPTRLAIPRASAMWMASREGRADLGGATDRPPVSDEDEPGSGRRWAAARAIRPRGGIDGGDRSQRWRRRILPSATALCRSR